MSRVVCTAYRTSKLVIAFALELRLCLEGPMVKRGPEGPTTTGQGSLWERKTRREEDGVGGSVAGWDNVWEGIAEWVVRSNTVRAEGVNMTS